MTPPPIDPANIAKVTLAQRIHMLRNAWRHPLAPGCSVEELEQQERDKPKPPPPITGGPLRASLLYAPIDIAAAATTVVLPIGVQGRKLIYELFIWNVGAQTIELWQGNNIRFLRLSNFPALTGILFGFNGSFDQPHFDIDPSEPFIIITSAATQVDGFIRYRIPQTNA